MPAALIAVLVALGVLCVGVFAVRGLARRAHHEDGDQVAEQWFTERSGPPGGVR